MRVYWCEEHDSPTGDRAIDSASECFLRLSERLWVRPCQFTERILIDPEELPEEAVEAAVLAYTKAEGFISPLDDAFSSMKAALAAAWGVLTGEADK